MVLLDQYAYRVFCMLRHPSKQAQYCLYSGLNSLVHPPRHNNHPQTRHTRKVKLDKLSSTYRCSLQSQSLFHPYSSTLFRTSLYTNDSTSIKHLSPSTSQTFQDAWRIHPREDVPDGTAGLEGSANDLLDHLHDSLLHQNQSVGCKIWAAYPRPGSCRGNTRQCRLLHHLRGHYYFPRQGLLQPVQ